MFSMVNVGYSLSSQSTATEWGNLKTLEKVIGRLFLLNCAWHKLHGQTLQAGGIGEIRNLQGSSEIAIEGPQKNNLQVYGCSEAHQ